MRHAASLPLPPVLPGRRTPRPPRTALPDRRHQPGAARRARRHHRLRHRHAPGRHGLPPRRRGHADPRPRRRRSRPRHRVGASARASGALVGAIVISPDRGWHGSEARSAAAELRAAADTVVVLSGMSPAVALLRVLRGGPQTAYHGTI